MMPDAVARPGSESELLEVLRQSYLERRPITPAGGQTSTTGASITDRGILLSLRGLTEIGEVDRERLAVRVQAGVLLGDLKRRLIFPTGTATSRRPR